MIQLSWNEDEQKVAHLLSQYSKDAHNILIAVAFLSLPGWKLVKDWLQTCLDQNCTLELFVGTDFYQTNPAALRAAESLLRGKKDSALWICEQNSKSVFHPKLYVFKRADEIIMVVGSSNLTRGGLQDNLEVCCAFSVSADSATAQEIEQIFEFYRSSAMTRRATIWDMAQYEGKWTRFRRHMKKAEQAVSKEIKSLPEIHEEKLRQYLSEYRADETKRRNYQVRENHYRSIPPLLNRLVEAETRTGFMEIYEQLVGKRGQGSLWHSNGLFRAKNQVADRFKDICKMIETIREHPDGSATELFEMGKLYIDKVRGLGVNVLTEVMNSYYPDRCPVLNNNSLSSLRHLAVGQFPEPQSFDTGDYDRFSEIIEYLRVLCQFDSMGQVDHFLNYVYQRKVKPSLKKSAD